MSRIIKLSIVMTFMWVLASFAIIYNLVYISYPEVSSGFWLVFIRSILVFTLAPPVIGWGAWWVIKK